MVSSHPGWIHALSQSAANNSVTHHRFSASILPCDLIFFVISFIIFILCCRFIYFPSVDSSCMLCRRCELYSLNKEKILAQQSSHHFVLLCFLILRTLLHSRGAPPPLKASLLLSSTLYLSRTSSSTLSAQLFQHWSISLWLEPSSLPPTFVPCIFCFFVHASVTAGRLCL